MQKLKIFNVSWKVCVLLKCLNFSGQILVKYFWLSPVVMWPGEHSFRSRTEHDITPDFHTSQLIVDMLDMFDSNLQRSQPEWQEHVDFISWDESCIIWDLPSFPDGSKKQEHEYLGVVRREIY